MKSKKFKFYDNVYWIVWIALVGILLIIRFMFYDSVKNHLFGLFITYILVTFGVFMIIGIFENYRYFNYLEKYYNEKWKYFGEPRWWYWYNKNYINFMYSNDDLGDAVIRYYKKLDKNPFNINTLVLTVFFTSPIIFILVINGI